MGSEEVSGHSRDFEKAMMGPKKTSHCAARPTTVPAHSPLFEDDMVLLDLRLDPSKSCVIAQKPLGMRERGGGLSSYHSMLLGHGFRSAPRYTLSIIGP